MQKSITQLSERVFFGVFFDLLRKEPCICTDSARRVSGSLPHRAGRIPQPLQRGHNRRTAALRASPAVCEPDAAGLRPPVARAGTGGAGRLPFRHGTRERASRRASSRICPFSAIRPASPAAPVSPAAGRFPPARARVGSEQPRRPPAQTPRAAHRAGTPAG